MFAQLNFNSLKIQNKMVEKNRGEQIVESLLQKPSKKPDFAAEIKNLLPHRVGKL